MKPLDPRLIRHASAARAFLVAGAALGLAQTVCTIAFAWFVSDVVVRAIAGASLGELTGPVVGAAATVLVRAGLHWLLEVTSSRASARVKSQLRGKVMAAIAGLGPRWLSTRNSAAVATLVGPGLDALDNYFAKYLPQLILTALSVPLVVLVLLAQDPLSGVIVLLTIPVIPVFMILIGQATKVAQRRQWERLTSLSTAFLDVVEGLSTLKIYRREKRQATRIETVTDGYRSTTMKVLRMSFLSGFALELAASLSVALVAVSIGLRLVDGSLGLAVGLFVLLLTPEAFLPLRQVGAHFHAAADGVAAADDVFDVLAAHDGIERATTPRTERPANGPLDIVDLRVGHGDRLVIDGLTARFDPGTLVVITGPSGVGKSTLVSALLGFLPHDGSITIDGRPVQPGGGWISWAGQRPGLMAGTVGANVALGPAELDAGPDDELVRRCLAFAAADSIAPETILGVRGAGLSGGQAHRVAIARAYYRALSLDSQVIVLDEPTSALDAGTERRVLDGIRGMAKRGFTVLVVSHRPAVVDAADQVLPIGSLVAVT